MPHEDACNNDSKLRVATIESGALGSAPERASSGTEDRISAPFPDCLPFDLKGDRRWTILDWRAARSRPHVCGVRSRSSEDDQPACRASPIASGLPCRAAHPMRGSRSTPLPSVTYRKDALASPFRVSRFPIPRNGPTPVERRIPVIRRRSLLSPHTQSQPRTSSRVDLTGLPLALVGAG